MTQVINDNLQINGDAYLKADNYVSLHYGNRGRLGQTPNFNPDQDRNGLWLEASQDGNESGGIFCNGNTIVLWSPGDNDTLRIYDEDDFGSPTLVPKFVINNAGNVGIGTANPTNKIHVVAPGGFPNNVPIVAQSQSTFFGALDPQGNERFAINLDSDGTGYPVNFYDKYDGNWRNGISLKMGNVGIGTTNPQAKLEVQSPWADWMFLRQQRNVEGGGGFHIHNPWGNSDQPTGDPSRNRLEIAYKTSTGQDLWGQFVLHGPSGNVGIGTANPQAKLHVNGDMIVTGDIVLQNADCAEEFAIKDLEMIEPGTVMVLGEEGSLCQSTEAYDKKVAGVVSGAGDLKPGLILDKQSESTNRMPIALMGKVYCKVDAEYAPIEVGDLLTTSPTPGHAMKATDPLKAFGTIIGKALRPLEAGKGLIPILVALQ
ncbi:MAG TPA: hypothetical protein DCY88_00855 [Cyanobacteria bacterium UBA11372]|nr:hypothetical protein [Cyanobacteria bacterium UBA11372]